MDGAAFALDMGTVMNVGAARGVDLDLLADVLPAAEAAILSGLSDEGDEG
jgi:hypothetical protein